MFQLKVPWLRHLNQIHFCRGALEIFGPKGASYMTYDTHARVAHAVHIREEARRTSHCHRWRGHTVLPMTQSLSLLLLIFFVSLSLSLSISLYLSLSLSLHPSPFPLYRLLCK